MKKTTFNSFLLCCSFLFFSILLFSCNNDEPSPAAKILITPSSKTIEIGQVAAFEYSVDSKIDLREIKISTENDIIKSIKTDFLTSKKHDGNFDITGKRADVGKILTITIEAIDVESNSSKETVIVKVDESNITLLLKTYSVTLGAQGNIEKGNFLDVMAQEVYNLEDAKVNASKLQLVYAYSGSKRSVIGSPNDETINSIFTDTENGLQTWTLKNRTRFKLTPLTKTDFDEITDGRIIREAYSEGLKPTNTDETTEYASQVNNLTEGSIFIFQTTAGKEGLVYVSELVQGQAGSIKLDIKVLR
ncbi:hypothetical protein ACE193_17885 [Bernardetia sp. OM2101]|uniref:hypothetical protein n=1 Tax=Bernardetia sp. OM2101 TaxID=3344876 RepID=UPI0035CEA6E5